MITHLPTELILHVLSYLDIQSIHNASFTCKQLQSIIRANQYYLVIHLQKYGQLNWDHLCRYTTLTESFMNEYDTYLNWYWISITQRLNERFILNHMYKLNWSCISLYQNLSDSFLHNYRSLIDWDVIPRKHLINYTAIPKHICYGVADQMLGS
jgi:hypothetical protein